MSQYELGYDRPGQDYHHFRANDYHTCSASCGSIDQCRAYTYVKPTQQGGSGTCWLKDGVPTRKVAKCCVSAVKVMSPDEMNVDRPGQNLRAGYAVSPPLSSQCESHCKADPDCQAWTFVKPGVQGSQAMCWLKKAKPKPVASQCCISGYRLIPASRRVPPGPTQLRSR